MPISIKTCRVSFWGPSPTSMGSWSKGPRNNEFVENGLQNWALAKWTVAKVGLRNNWAQENPVNVHIFSVRGDEIDICWFLL